MNIIIVDIGNSKVKCNAIKVNPTTKYGNRFELLYSESKPTPRKDPYDLINTVRDLIRIVNTFTPPIDVGMITAFGDAFIHYRQGERFPYYVFADEPADKGIPYAYSLSGFPTDIELSSVRALKSKHNAEWANMFSPNNWVANQLTEKPDKNPENAWDITQSSITGIYNLWKDKWIHTGFTSPPPPPIPSQKIIGHIEDIPFMAGGLDNAFVDSEDSDPYIVAGTWLVIGNVFEAHDSKAFTTDRKNTVRWLISGNRNYHAQVVRKVNNPITEVEKKQIIADLLLLGLDTYLEDDKDGFTQRITPRVKVFGGYGEALAEDLQALTRKFRFSTVGGAQQTELYQHQMSALFASNHYWKGYENQ